MKFKTNVIQIGGSMYALIPPAIIENYNIEVGEDALIINATEGKKGKYLEVWTKKEDIGE